jgi:hypothetical protein
MVREAPADEVVLELASELAGEGPWPFAWWLEAGSGKDQSHEMWEVVEVLMI